MAKFSTRLTAKLTRAAGSVWVLPALFFIQVAETTFIPMPYEALFVALCAVAKQRIWLFVAVSGAGSAVAGAIMYSLGASFAEPVSAWLGVERALTELKPVILERGASFIFLGGTTPAPSYLVNLAAGASGFPFWPFLMIFRASRILRFALLGVVIYYFGDSISAFWRRAPKWLRRTLLTGLIAGLIFWFVAGFL